MQDKARDSKEAAGAMKRAELEGIDVSLLLANLRLTPLQRIRQHQRATNLAERLRCATTRRCG